MKTLLASFLFVTLVNIACSEPSRANADAIPLHRENIEWCDVWHANANKTDQPAVLIIGDSISKGYGGTVEKGLAGQFPDRAFPTLSIRRIRGSHKNVHAF